MPILIWLWTVLQSLFLSNIIVGTIFWPKFCKCASESPSTSAKVGSVQEVNDHEKQNIHQKKIKELVCTLSYSNKCFVWLCINSALVFLDFFSSVHNSLHQCNCVFFYGHCHNLEWISFWELEITHDLRI